MFAFRLFLVAAFVAIAFYTVLTVAAEGWNLFPAFFMAIAAVNWQGQFNFDFSTYLLLSAIWVAWRHQFSAPGLALALVASVGGMLFLSAYLLVVSFRTGGDVNAMLLGVGRARALS